MAVLPTPIIMQITMLTMILCNCVGGYGNQKRIEIEEGHGRKSLTNAECHSMFYVVLVLIY